MASRDEFFKSEQFIPKLIQLAGSITIKFENLATENETEESALNARHLILAKSGNDTYTDYMYDESDFAYVGFTPTMPYYNEALNNPKYIPEIFRSVLLEYKRSKITDSYVEKNEYYRMLSGLPKLGEDPYYFSTLDKYVTYMTDEEVEEYKDELYEISMTDIDSYKYLRYLGAYSIDPYTARIAENYDILYYKNTLFNDDLNSEFLNLYDSTRTYMYALYYSKSYTTNKFYDNFLALAMLWETMNKFTINRINTAIERDFYDSESIKNMMISYGFPYYREVPVTYQNRILKNMNQILQYKGTNKVLIDICNLFSFSNIQIYKYYLIKDFKYYIDQKPYIDPSVPLEDMYDVYFQRVPIETFNPAIYIFDPEYRLEYDFVTNDDPTWGGRYPGYEDDLADFKHQILNLDFNYVETKYMRVDIMIEVTKCMLETCYFFNMLVKYHTESLIDEMRFTSTAIKSSGNYIRVIDAVFAMYYLLHYRFGYDADLQYRPESVGMFYGFNFDEENITRLNNAIENYISKFKSESFREKYFAYFTLPTEPVTNAVRFITQFEEMLRWVEFIKDAIVATNDINEYRALYEIYIILTRITSVRNVFSETSEYREENEVPIIIDETEQIIRTQYGGIITDQEDKYPIVMDNGVPISRSDYIVSQLDNTITITGSISSINNITISYSRLDIDFTYTNLDQYLQANDSELYEYCQDYITLDNESTVAENVASAILTILDSLQLYFNSDTFDEIYDYLSSSLSDIYKKYLFKLLNTFKAYTIDIKSANLIWLLDDRTENTLIMIDECILHSILNKGDSLKYRMIHYFRQLLANRTFKDWLMLDVVKKFIGHRTFYDKIDFEEILLLIGHLIKLDKIKLMDLFSHVYCKLPKEDYLRLEELLVKAVTAIVEDDLHLKDEIIKWGKILGLDKLKIMDLISSRITNKDLGDDTIDFADMLEIDITTFGLEDLDLKEIFTRWGKLTGREKLKLINYISSYHSNIDLGNDTMEYADYIEIDLSAYPTEEIEFNEEVIEWYKRFSPKELNDLIEKIVSIYSRKGTNTSIELNDMIKATIVSRMEDLITWTEEFHKVSKVFRYDENRIKDYIATLYAIKGLDVDNFGMYDTIEFSEDIESVRADTLTFSQEMLRYVHDYIARNKVSLLDEHNKNSSMTNLNNLMLEEELIFSSNA